MRKLVLTGMSSEHSFFPQNGHSAGEAKIFLIFNDGEFRVEVSQEAAEACVAKMMEDEAATPEVEDTRQTTASPKPAEVAQRIVMQKVDSTYTDEDGVDQV